MIETEQDITHNSQLNKKTAYIDYYSPNLLYPIPRDFKRRELNLKGSLPFFGYDTWNNYECGWLNSKGKPAVAIAVFHFPCTTPKLIESKSFKLYLNSFNNTQFSSSDEVRMLMQKDLSAATGGDVIVMLHPLDKYNETTIRNCPGTCIDHLDIDVEHYQPNPDYLITENTEANETLYSNLLRSNCPVTGQPDWGTLIIEYSGRKLSHAGLLKYIISLRNHTEFAEQCVERVFMHILRRCQPALLTVTARYTRRGGMDINPYRSTQATITLHNQRLIRQ